MKFDNKKTAEKLGKMIGFIIAYFLFTTIIFFIFSFTKRIPEGWTYFHIAGITLAITLLGVLIKQLLK